MLKSLKIGVSVILLMAVIYAVASTINFVELRTRVMSLSALTVVSVTLLLLLNAFAAAYRLQILSADMGHRISFSRSVAALSSGNLLGSIFFQLPGQLIARGSIMGRHGVPFAAVATLTLYEKLGAAFVSGLLALGGASLIFGHVFVDREAGGFDLIKIVVGLLSASMAGAVAGYGRLLIDATLPHIDRNVAIRIIRMFGLNLLVQLPMLAAFTTTGHALAPSISLEKLSAAAAIVMFAANIPISLSGWGVRELSAVFALGAVGVSLPDAVVASVLIGAGSTIVLAVLAIVTIRTTTGAAVRVEPSNKKGVDYGAFICWALPLGAATLVFFQIYIPGAAGTLLNVNLADPIALLGAAFFLLSAWQTRGDVQWRRAGVGSFAVVFTIVMTIGLLIGFVAHGWTQWAWINRYLGWFVLLAYFMSGALAVRKYGDLAIRIFLLTFSAAATAIVCTELLFVAISMSGVKVPTAINPTTLQGFAQNRNFFAFQLLIAFASALVVFPRQSWARWLVLRILFLGLVLTGSRSGWITMAGLCITAYTLGALRIEKRDVGVTMCLCSIAAVLFSVAATRYGSPGISFDGVLWPSEVNTSERLLSIKIGWGMFMENPIFGEGLGAFRELNIPSSTPGVPLLIHSTAVWLLAELGLVGLLAFAAPFFLLAISEIRAARDDARALLAVLYLLVFGIMSLPADMTYQRTFWLMLGVALAVAAPTHQKPLAISLVSSSSPEKLGRQLTRGEA